MALGVGWLREVAVGAGAALGVVPGGWRGAGGLLMAGTCSEEAPAGPNARRNGGPRTGRGKGAKWLAGETAEEKHSLKREEPRRGGKAPRRRSPVKGP